MALAIGGGITFGGGISILEPVVPAGQTAYTTPGTYTWTPPAGVTSVCVVCVGGGGGGLYYNVSNSAYTYAMGGGGGGGLAWVNDIPVTPGGSYTVVVGVGGSLGAYPSGSTAGGQSYFMGTNICRAYGGSAGRYVTTAFGGNYSVTTAYGTRGGGQGGASTYSGYSTAYGPAGGGGAGGYTGNGGVGRDNLYASGVNGSGGGGAGGGASAFLSLENHLSGGGGGVGIYGQGSSGVASQFGTGGGGSGGTAGQLNSGINACRGGNFGGGGGGSATSYWGTGGNGGGGAVRIIWSGDSGITRAFPSTNTGDL